MERNLNNHLEKSMTDTKTNTVPVQCFLLKVIPIQSIHCKIQKNVYHLIKSLNY